MKKFKDEALQEKMQELYEAIQNFEVMKSSALINEISTIIEKNYKEDSKEAKLFFGMARDYDLMMEELFTEADESEEFENDANEWY